MHVRPLRVLVAALAVGALAPGPLAAQSEGVAPLPEPGASVRRTIAAGERHVYRFAGAAPFLIDLHVTPVDADVAVSVRAAGGPSVLTAANDAPTAYGDEWLIAITETDGEHLVTVTADRVIGTTGSYRLSVSEAHAAVERDRFRLTGLELLRAGTKARVPGTREAATAALDAFTRAAEAFRGGQDPYGEATALHNAGVLQRDLTGRATARVTYERALALFRQAGRRASEARMLSALGDLHFLQGERRQAAEYHEQAIAILQTHEDRNAMASVLVRLGLALSFLGQKQRALDAYQSALDIARAIGDRSNEMLAVLNTGQEHNELGDWDRALEHYQQALTLARAISDVFSEISILNNMGTVHAARGDGRTAIALYEEALAIRRRRQTTNSEGAALSNLGWAYDSLGARERAREYFEQALVEWRAGSNRAGEAATLNNLGRVQAAMGDVAGGLATLERALEIRRAIADPAPQALTLYNIARILRDDGRLAEAQARVEEGLDVIERLRRSVTSPELRSTFLASVLGYYELAIDVRMTRHAQEPAAGHAARAWQLAERARARSLLEGLADARAQIQPRTDPAITARLAERQDALDAALGAESTVLRRKHSPEEAAAAARAVAEAAAEVRLLQLRMRADDPQYAALMDPAPLALEDVQQSLLDEDTTLVEFALGTRHSYAWVVTRDRMIPIVLPARQDIEPVATQLHAAAAANDVAAASRAAQALSNVLLAPLAPHLTTRRLAIVAEGALQTVPYGALPDPASKTGALLITTHDLSLAPSVATVALLRQPRTRTSSLDVAVVADPVFDAGDSRVTNRNAPATPPTPALSSRRSPQSFGRLIGSRREARAIADMVAATRRYEAFDFAARREIVDEGRLGSARFVHFATHAVVDSQRPDLSGLVLSLVDRAGTPVNGFLRLHDIYNLRLSADLVVLSACQTALGKAIGGEGLVGLVRGFMHAGAPRVVASLWQVDDRATAELMKRFYGHMLGADSMAPAAALRAAQREMAGTVRHRSPYYWAGFVLQGDWQ